MFTRLGFLLGLVSIIDAKDCGYVYTDTSISGFAALDTCGEYSISETVGPITQDITISFRYQCNSDGSAVYLYTWQGADNCSSISSADSTLISDDSSYFNCGEDKCGALVTLTRGDGSGCDTLTDTYITYPFLTGYCVYYTNDDEEYSELYSCTDNSLIYKEYNTSETCSTSASYKANLQDSCTTLTVSLGDYEVSGSFLFTVDDCNNAFNNGVSFIAYLLGIMSAVWSILK